MKPLQNIKVLEMEGLAPTVLAGRILSDFGAHVTIVSRQEKQSLSMDTHETILNHGKQSVTIDLKSKQDIEILKKMIKEYNVLIDAYKPGIMEKLGIGPNECFKINPKLVYARISSFGQDSQLSHQAAHDINFISYSGALSMMASTGNNPHTEQPPAFPANLFGDFAAGSCLGVIGILVALQHVQNGGNGQVVDLGMAQASLYLSQFIINSKIHQVWNRPRGHNLLDGGAHFYNVYKCSDDKFISLGCIEPKFYEKFVQILQTQNDVVSKEFCDELLENHLNIDKWAEFKVRLQELFQTKTRQQWTDIFKGSESCFSPVYEAYEIKQIGNHLLGQKDRSFLIDLDNTDSFNFLVSPQPVLSDMPKEFQIINLPKRGQHNNIKPKL